MLGVSAARVGRIERHPGVVTLDNLLAILRLLGARLELVDAASASSDERRRQRTPTGRRAATVPRKSGKGAVRPTGEW